MSTTRRLSAWIAQRPRLLAAALLGPGGLFLAACFLAPLAILAGYSVMPRGVYGGVERGFTLAHYARFMDPLYLGILRRTVLYALACTAACLALGFPLAAAIARAGRWKHVLLFLTVLPLWTSLLVRTYALIVVLRDNGPVNAGVRALGLADAPLALLYTRGAVLLGLVVGFLPLMVLPIYAALEKLDPVLLEAAETLGAGPGARFRRVVLPLAMPGVVAGCLLVFIPALGAYVTPDLLGGAREMMVGNLVQNQFTAARNWPFGAAAAFVVTATVLGGVVLLLRLRARYAAL